MLGTTRHIGKYVLHEQLGRGGAAEVWRAFDPTLERDVAIKFLLPSRQASSDAAQRFQREARAIASLCHPNIIQIYDISSDRYPINSDDNQNDIAYMVMPYIQGPTLAKYIEQTSRIGKFPSPAEIVNLFTALGSAIDYAHTCGMIHRDIKPANILLDQRNAIDSIGFPILTDFGLVKLQDPSFDKWQSANAVLGTPLYVAPEQAQGFATTELSDLYSLGVILYELCTGKLPFDFPEQPADQHPLAALMQRVMFAPIPPSHVNPSIS
ncbi:MAG: serine/threonine protein kinase, partial [Chloroflexi bacterium]|nr:serine/threonine protein kinase [Chloroflexota bacterium]